MESILLVSVLSSIGLGLSSFFGLFLIRSNRLDNRLLALLMIILSLRMTKSIFYTAMDLPLFIKNLGIAANLAVAPLLLLYGMVLAGKSKISRIDYLHFLPSLTYVMLCGFIPNQTGNLLWATTYGLVLLHSFIYVFFSLRTYQTMNGVLDHQLKKWYLQLTLSLAALWTMYTLIYLTVIPVYAFGPIAFSILMFILAFVGLNTKKLFLSNGKKYASSRMSDDEGEEILTHLTKLMREEKMYLKSDLSLTDLAQELTISEREVSQVINRHAKQNFASFVNKYRIDEAKQRLNSKDKILAVALEVGFNNLTSFNQAFKSMTGQTPSEFRSINFH